MIWNKELFRSALRNIRIASGMDTVPQEKKKKKKNNKFLFRIWLKIMKTPAIPFFNAERNVAVNILNGEVTLGKLYSHWCVIRWRHRLKLIFLNDAIEFRPISVLCPVRLKLIGRSSQFPIFKLLRSFQEEMTELSKISSALEFKNFLVRNDLITNTAFK